MPAAPHYPSDEPDERTIPDLGDLVDSILRGRDKSPSGAGGA